MFSCTICGVPVKRREEIMNISLVSWPIDTEKIPDDEFRIDNVCGSCVSRIIHYIDLYKTGVIK